MKHEEQKIQIKLVHFLRHITNLIVHHSPNGGIRNKRTACLLKAMGVLAGFPDLIIISQNKILFIELKYGKGKMSDSQKEISDKIKLFGFPFYEIKALDEFEAIEKLFNIFRHECIEIDEFRKQFNRIYPNLINNFLY